MLIYVGHKDIHSGVEGDCLSCPVALAINRRLHKGHCVYVNNFKVKIIDNEFNQVIRDFELPLKAQRFINRFDTGFIEPDPLIFELKGLVDFNPHIKKAYDRWWK